MNTEFLKSNIEKLESVFLNIIYMKPNDRIIVPNMSILGDMKNAINDIFDENDCLKVIYTHNVDKSFFGIKISPAMSPADAVVILGTDEIVRLKRYQIEFDSKLFDIDLSESELAALTIFQIANMMDSNGVFEKLRFEIDKIAVNDDDIVRLKDSINYAQLVIFAIKDTMSKYANIIYKKEDDLTQSPIISACEYEDEILSAYNKITSNISTEMMTENPVILQWMFLMIQDIKHCSGIIKDTLNDSKAFTASKLDIEEINKTITSIDHIDMSIIESSYLMENLNKFFDSKNVGTLNEISIFKNLKKNGLRGLENELYEFAMRVKNCSTSDDAYLIMRGLNSRIGILEDYLANENLSEYDVKHWSDVCNRYRDLRSILASKKFKEKNYGLWYNYEEMDNNE